MISPLRSAVLAAVALGGLVAAGGCQAGRKVGASCVDTGECGGTLGCLPETDGFPGGYCTRDCSEVPCPDGALCAEVAGVSLCLRACETPADCRGDGYQCFQGVCTLACAGDGDCGKGFLCEDGQCAPRPGAALGEPCSADAECSSEVCLRGVCVQACTHDQPCADGETCGLNAFGDGVETPTTHITPACTPRRGTAAPGEACTADPDCDRGSCQLGICVELCATTPDCHGAEMSCAKLVTVLGNDTTPSFRGCLPARGVLELDVSAGSIPVPSTAQAMAIYVRNASFDLGNVVGVVRLEDPMGGVVYTPPTTLAEFFALPVRYQPAEAASTMLLPNAPGISLLMGRYFYQVASSKGGALSTRVYLKLGDAPIATGQVSLNFYLPDLSGACQPLTVATAPTQLATAVAEVVNIYAQAGITITDVTWQAVPGLPNSIRMETDPNAPRLFDLEQVLGAATVGQSTTAGFDVVLLRSITDAKGAQSGVLGVAGGLPTSPVRGTPHSGVVVSMQSLCFFNQKVFGATIAHELGHASGLFHNLEMSGDHDPLPDTGEESSNLMYWIENAGKTLSPQQGQVLRNDPKVRP